MRRHPYRERSSLTLAQGGEPPPVRGVHPPPADAAARRLLRLPLHLPGKRGRPQPRYRSGRPLGFLWMRRHWLPRRTVWLRNTACRHRAVAWWCCPGKMTGRIFPLPGMKQRRLSGRRPALRRRLRPLHSLSPYRQRPPALRRLLPPPSLSPHLSGQRLHPGAVVRAARQQPAPGTLPCRWPKDGEGRRCPYPSGILAHLGGPSLPYRELFLPHPLNTAQKGR